MRATVEGHVVAESNDIVECKGYQYFPRTAVRMDWLEKTAKTESDKACPHGVQFYDVVIDGVRAHNGMVSFSRFLKPQDVEDVRAFLISQAKGEPLPVPAAGATTAVGAK